MSALFEIDMSALFEIDMPPEVVQVHYYNMLRHQ
jgi:hypothetical protein